MKPAILFDLDGTLLYTDELIKESFIRVFKKYKPEYTLSNEELLSFLGPSLFNTFSKYFSSNMINEVIDYYQEFNLAHHEQYVIIYPTVVETLNTLKQLNYPLGVVTTKMRKSAYVGLDLFDLTKYFDIVLGHEDVANTKPDPEGIIKAMDLLNVDKAYYVGDNVSDIEAGKNAKVKTIAVKWSPKVKLLEETKPDYLIDEMIDILEIIKEDY